MKRSSKKRRRWRERGIDDAVEVEPHDLAQASAHRGSAPRAHERGVGLHHVELGVHRLRRVLVLVAQPHVLEGAPVAGAGLEVAAVDGVGGVLLDEPEQLERLLERLGAARGGVVLGEPVQGEGERVRLLAVRDGAAVAVEHPVDAAVDRVAKRAGEPRVEVVGGAAVGGLARPPVRGRERPQQAGAEDAAERSRRVGAGRRRPRSRGSRNVRPAPARARRGAGSRGGRAASSRGVGGGARRDSRRPTISDGG